jgi:hypothetical protein
MANRFCARALTANERAEKPYAEATDPGPTAAGKWTWLGEWSWLSDQSDAIEGEGPTCLPMRDGSVWAIEMLQGKPQRWTLAHYSPDGRRQSLAPMPADWSVGGLLAPARVVAFDYDGDGLEEFWVENMRWCGWEPAQKLYTFRAGRLVPYPLPHAVRVDEIHDIDKDGRPDLIAGSLLEVKPVPCSFGDIVCAGYRFQRLLHSLPDGTFSEDDSVARRYAEEQCKDNPPGQPVVVRKDYAPAEVDGAKTADAIACARLRGVPSERILAELRTECPSVVQSSEARRYVPARSCISHNCTAAEQAAQVRACPAPALHPTCIDWMFDLARQKTSPILR